MNPLSTLLALALALAASLAGNLWQWHAHSVDNAVRTTREVGQLALAGAANEASDTALAQCQARAWELAGTQAQADASRAKAEATHSARIRALTEQIAARDAAAEQTYATDSSCAEWGRAAVCAGVSRRVLQRAHGGEPPQGR